MNSTNRGFDSDVLTAVVTQVANHLGVNSLELDPLADVIDPELVSDFVDSDAVTDDSELRFRYHGFDVRVTGSGDVRLDERA